MTPTPVVVPACVDDLPALSAIHEASLGLPWKETDLLRELDLAWSHVDVLKEPVGGLALAFAVSWIVGGELDLLTLATHPDRRREGHAVRLVRHLLVRAVELGCSRATLEVRRSNEPALGLYAGLGFIRVGLRPRYYQDNGEDALILALPL